MTAQLARVMDVDRQGSPAHLASMNDTSRISIHDYCCACEDDTHVNNKFVNFLLRTTSTPKHPRRASTPALHCPNHTRAADSPTRQPRPDSPFIVPLASLTRTHNMT